MDDSSDDQPPKTNGKANGKDHGTRIVSFPDAQERERIRKEREEIEKAKHQNEKAWQKAYRSKEKGEKVPFFTDRAKSIPPFSKYIVMSFVVIFIITNLLPAEQYEWVMLNFSFIPARYTGDMEWSFTALLSPVTSLFMHYNLMHLITNGFMMLVLGTFFERSFGAKRGLMFFLLCGLSGNLLYFLLNFGLFKPMMGASGAIDGFFAVLLIVNWAQMPLPPHLRKKKYVSILIFWIFFTIILGLIIPGTAWEAHLGGLLAGWGTFELWRRGKIKI